MAIFLEPQEHLASFEIELARYKTSVLDKHFCITACYWAANLSEVVFAKYGKCPKTYNEKDVYTYRRLQEGKCRALRIARDVADMTKHNALINRQMSTQALPQNQYTFVDWMMLGGFMGFSIPTNLFVIFENDSHLMPQVLEEISVFWKGEFLRQTL